MRKLSDSVGEGIFRKIAVSKWELEPFTATGTKDAKEQDGVDVSVLLAKKKGPCAESTRSSVCSSWAYCSDVPSGMKWVLTLETV